MPRSTQCLPLRACGARPSGAGLAQHGWPCGENTGITRRAVFSEGRALRVRKYGPDANQGIPFPDGFTISRWPRGPMPWSSQCLPSRACGARPSAGRPSRAGMALRGRPGDDAKGDFLGGTRSPRPHCEAVREPRHNMIIGGKGTPGGLMGRSPGKSEVSLTGVRSPPLREGASPVRMA
jgi:hypothetical protein